MYIVKKERKTRKTMKTELINITPEMALDMLSKNSANRRVRQSRVQFYAEQMKKGNWHLTGQTITFDKNGQLLDGQHRLYAIVESEVTLPFLVVTDAEPATEYDCGIPRNMQDRLLLGGVNLPDSIMSTNGLAVVKFCMTIERTGTCSKEGRNIATDDLIAWCEKNLSDITEITELLYSISGSNSYKGCRRAIIFATLYEIRRVDERLTKADIEKIVSIIRSGVMTENTDAPIIGFRNKLISVPRMPNIEVFYRLQFAIRRYLSGTTNVLNRYDTKNVYDFKNVEREEN